jgi:hypothetical protein
VKNGAPAVTGATRAALPPDIPAVAEIRAANIKPD